MKLKTILIVLVILIAFTGCVTQRKCNLRFPTENTKDSIYIETIKEIPVILPADTINVEVPVNCPDQDLVNVETSKLKQEIKILNGKLVSKTQIKQDTVFIHTKETKTITKEVKEPQPVKYIPKVIKILAWTGGTGLTLLLVIIILKYGRKFIPL